MERGKDLVRYAHVLKARDRGVAWENVYEHVAATVEGAGSANAIKKAYVRVSRAFQKGDPTPYLFLPEAPPKK
jgi:hypothetical protein